MELLSLLSFFSSGIVCGVLSKEHLVWGYVVFVKFINTLTPMTHQDIIFAYNIKSIKPTSDENKKNISIKGLRVNPISNSPN